MKLLFHFVFSRSHMLRVSRCHRQNKQRKTSPLCLLWVWQLNAMAHSTAQENCTQPNWKKQNVYIVNYDYHPSKFRVGLFVCTWSFRGKKRYWNRNGKRDENIWLEKIIQIWLNPAGLNTLLSANRSPTEIHRNALHGRDVSWECWKTSWN